ncbi:MAG: hypothetical protein WD757_04990 [Actinomycetota bacterium]
MAAGSGKGPWIVAGAVVVAGIIVAIALVIVLSGGSGPEPSPSGSPTQTQSPSTSPSPSKSPRPKPTKSPRPSPSPSPSPVVNNALLVRQSVERAANNDRPGQVKHVGHVDFYRNRQGCSSGDSASANVRYTEADPQKTAVWISCRSGSRWIVTQGPIYGE